MLTWAVELDHLLRTWIVTHRIEALNGLMWFMSVIGRGGIVFGAAALVIAVRRRCARDFVHVAAAILVASLAADHVLKPAVHRTRPFVSTPTVPVIGGRPHDSSFPSGHAASAFAGAVTLDGVAPGGAALWWALAAAIAYSRVYLGVHYPADVAAGAVVGLLAGAAVRWATRHTPG